MTDHGSNGVDPQDTSGDSPWLSALLGLVVSALFVWLTLRKVDLGEVAAQIGEVSLLILSLNVVTKFFGFVFMTWRSQVLFKHLDDYEFWPMFKSVLVAFVGNNVLPLRAGELLRVGYLSHGRDEVPTSSCFAAVALERLLDLFSLALLFLLLIFFAFLDFSQRGVPGGMIVSVVVGILVAAMATAIWISRQPDPWVNLVDRVAGLMGDSVASFVTPKFRKFAEGLAGLSSWRQTAAVLALSIAYWGTAVASIYVWIWAFGWSLPIHAPFVVAVFSAFATVLPSSPGFVGTYHWAVKTGVGFFGVGAAGATSFAIVGHAAAFLPFTIIGIAILAGDYLRGEISSASSAAR